MIPRNSPGGSVGKMAQYAAAGIAVYLIVVLDDKYDVWEIRESHRDAAAAAYRLHSVHASVLVSWT